MALSQKYSGTVLVPWFNVAEWKSVKDLIYSDNLESKQLALERIKMWKLRTPQLSAGIDGTMILLEALLEEKNNLTNKVLNDVYSISLVRFLNICAANNVKQGTFYKTAEKNDLPPWLISLRHDIAHNNVVPAQSFLKKALNVCFQWVKEKYWDVTQMEDYVVSDKINFKDLIHSCCRLKLLHYFKESTDALIEEIENKDLPIFDELNHGFTTEDFITLFEDHLIQSVDQDKIKDSSIHIVSTLVEDEVILTIKNCYINGVKRIPSNFLQIWDKLLNFLFQNGKLFILINKLADITDSDRHEHSVMEIASLWIAELYQGLLKAKKMNEKHSKHAASKLDSIPQNKNIVTFSEFKILPMDDSRRFLDRILEAPNKYTINYLEMVVKFNGNTENCITKKVHIIKELFQVVNVDTIYNDNTSYDDNTIFSVHELQAFVESHESKKRNSDTQLENGRTEGRRKFRKLTDGEKFAFKGYAFGIYPPELVKSQK